jgi:hypothetical protein
MSDCSVLTAASFVFFVEREADVRLSLNRLRHSAYLKIGVEVFLLFRGFDQTSDPSSPGGVLLGSSRADQA